MTALATIQQPVELQHPVSRAAELLLAAQHTYPHLTGALTEVAEIVGALGSHIDALDHDLRGLRDQGLEDAREISRLRATNEALNARLYQMNLEQADDARAWANMKGQLTDTVADLGRLLQYADALRTHHHS
jgi:ABC-type transporter Mla subunit MlaD